MNNTDDPFLITSRLGITSVLRALMTQKTLVHMRPARTGQAIITTVLDVDPDQEHIIVDAAEDATFNERLARTGTIHFDAQVDRIRVQFSTSQASHQVFENRDAFRFPYPDALRRLQRRNHFRIDIPVSMPLICDVRIKGGHTLMLSVKDISAGGLALLDPGKDVTDGVGDVLRRCSLDLDDAGTVVTDLKIRRISDPQTTDSATARVVACEFHHLSAPGNIIVQKYIGRLDRLLNARRRGFD